MNFKCSATYRSGQIKQLIYSFNKIYDETINQKELFEQTCLPLVQDLLNGKNGVLFTYGVTGSGKTYTMMGNTKEPGLLQRTLDTLFNSILNNQAKRNAFKSDRLNSFELNQEQQQQQQQKIYPLLPPKTPSRLKAQADTIKLNEGFNDRICDTNDKHVYSLYISACEIYNNYIYDLLEDKRDESKVLKEDLKGQMYIKDINEVEVKSTEEALELAYRAFKKRVVAHTDLNQESSRSHSIFTIRCLQTNLLDPNKHSIQISQLSLVDLAGCERTKRTKNTGSRLKEAGNINSSLMALRNCIEALKDNNNNKMIPYRDSKLTLLFKNYFEGYGNIKMILCINPSELEFDETIVSLTWLVLVLVFFLKIFVLFLQECFKI
jgi:kinesin family member 23